MTYRSIMETELESGDIILTEDEGPDVEALLMMAHGCFKPPRSVRVEAKIYQERMEGAWMRVSRIKIVKTGG